MEVRVKLFGTLSHGFPGYQHTEGMVVEVPEGATARDLLALLRISKSQGAAVAMEGRILKGDDPLRSGVPVHVLQVLHGG